MLKLNNDLYLSHNVTLTAGGSIKGNAANYGQANTIFMGGDLTLASDSYGKTLHITGDWANNGQSGDLIIDGCGHTLTIGDWGQLFVDQNVTLTLRNMTIKTSPKSSARPAIKLASLGSKLALDNVLFDLGSDFKFTQGQLFIHDEVAVTGTSAFVYTSPKPSFITSGATWSFETGTTFSIAPATYTDQPFTAGTATSNNFIVLADQTAALSLSNCSLKTTFTGARFSKGMVLFDNKVALDTQAGNEISGLGSASGNYWGYTGTFSNAMLSPDGRYVAATYTNGGTAGVHINDVRFPGDVSKMVQINLGTGTSVPALAWSADGKFVAVGYSNGTPVGFMLIFRFNGLSSVTQVGSAVIFGKLVNSISWSPDGKYLAVGGNNGSTPLIVYRFDGTNLTQVTTANQSGNTIQINGVAWSPDGKYLFTVMRHNVSLEYMYLYSFNGTTLTNVQNGGNPGNATSGAWSPDGRFIAHGWRDTTSGSVGRCYIYTFNGSGLTNVIFTALGTQVNAVAWSPDGRYLLDCSTNGTAGTYQVYRVTPSGATPLIIPRPDFGSIANTVAWSPDGAYVFIGGTDATTNAILLRYPTTQVATAANTQGFSNGLLFGDKAKGTNFDANVQILGGAVVKVRGMVKDDSF
jgi:Tol biopolymer transport system component